MKVVYQALVWKLGWWICRLYLGLVHGVSCSGREHVPAQGPLILIANHQSHFDPPLVGIGVGRRRPFVSLAKASLFDPWWLGWLLRALNAVPVFRDRSDVAAMKALLSELRTGRAVLLFPEGGRCADGRTAPLQRGVVLLLKRAAVPVVPIAIEGAFDVWPRDRTLPRLSGRLAVRVAPPIAPDDLLKDGPDAALDRLRRQLETMRLELRAELRDRTNGRVPPPGPADQPYWASEPDDNRTSPSPTDVQPV